MKSKMQTPPRPNSLAHPIANPSWHLCRSLFWPAATLEAFHGRFTRGFVVKTYESESGILTSYNTQRKSPRSPETKLFLVTSCDIKCDFYTSMCNNMIYIYISTKIPLLRFTWRWRNFFGNCEEVLTYSLSQQNRHFVARNVMLIPCDRCEAIQKCVDWKCWHRHLFSLKQNPRLKHDRAIFHQSAERNLSKRPLKNPTVTTSLP